MRNPTPAGKKKTTGQAELIERLEDSTELLRTFVGSHADEFGAVRTQVSENEQTLRCLSEKHDL